MKNCNLTNIYTKKRIKSKSIAAFCRLSKLENKDKDARIHIYPILKEERFSHYGWCLSKNYNKYVKLKDVYGNVYGGYVRDLVDKFDKVTFQKLWWLIVGKRKVVNSISLYTTEIDFIPLNPFKIKQIRLTTPNNKILVGNKIVYLTKQIHKNNLSYRRLLDLVHGKTDVVKGYKIKDIEIELKKILK